MGPLSTLCASFDIPGKANDEIGSDPYPTKVPLPSLEVMQVPDSSFFAEAVFVNSAECRPHTCDSTSRGRSAGSPPACA